MCYTKEASKRSFLIGMISSGLLIFLSNQLVLKLIGFAFIFISLMQLIDYMIWDDIDCKKGSNQLASKLGFLLILIQPLLICLALFVDNSPYKNIIIAINAIYFIYGIHLFMNYKKGNNLCSKLEDGRTNWDWLKVFEKTYLGPMYIGLFIINTLVLVRNKYAILAAILVFLGSLISYFNYKYHFAEFWCYFSTSVPLIVLIVSKLNLL